MRVHRTVNTVALKKVLEAAGETAAQDAGERVLARARELCVSRTVANSLQVYTSARGRVTVGTPLDLAYWIEKGTGIYGPHHTPIVPVHSKVLVFPSSSSRSGYVFAKSVVGVPARPFLEPALQAVRR